jgi:hypothetical protein
MKIVMWFLVLSACALGQARSVVAQTLTPTSRGQVSGKAHKADHSDLSQSDKGVDLLQQADISVDNDTTQLGLQALTLFFTRDWRFYVRSTVPVPKENNADDAAPALPGAALSAPTLDDAAIAALLDPYGGILNLSAGVFPRLWSAADADHGLFVDARVGMKLISLPGQTDSAPTVLNTKVTPFYSGAIMLKVVRQLFDSAAGEHVAGGFEFGVGYVANVVADESASRVFTSGTLQRTTHNARIDAAISLNKVAAIDISWNPWSSNDLGRRFVVGLKLLNQDPAVK